MENQNANNIKPTQNILKISEILNKLNIKHSFIGNSGITLGIVENNVFVSINIIDEEKSNRIAYYAKMRNLSFDAELLSVIQDIISEINNVISYGHISLGSVGSECVALYRCHSPAKYITTEEIKYNINACNYMVHKYFTSFDHLRI